MPSDRTTLEARAEFLRQLREALASGVFFPATLGSIAVPDDPLTRAHLTTALWNFLHALQDAAEPRLELSASRHQWEPIILPSLDNLPSAETIAEEPLALLRTARQVQEQYDRTFNLSLKIAPSNWMKIIEFQRGVLQDIYTNIQDHLTLHNIFIPPLTHSE